jgi:hypothetical protein
VIKSPEETFIQHGCPVFGSNLLHNMRIPEPPMFRAEVPVTEERGVEPAPEVTTPADAVNPLAGALEAHISAM